MAGPIERLFQEWHRLGGRVLLAEAKLDAPARPPEEVLAESTASCRGSGRLTWVVLDWLIHHVDEINDEHLLEQTLERGDLSVLGVLCDAARQRKPHPKFERLIRGCRPNRQLEPFFHRVEQSPLALQLTRNNALNLFRRWNYLCSELRYLDASSAQTGPAFREP